RATCESLLYRLHTLGVSIHILANLDFEGAKALFKALRNLLLNVPWCRAVERRQDRQCDIPVDAKQRVTFQHLDRGQKRRRRDLAGIYIGGDDRLGLVSILSDNSRRVLGAKFPTLFTRLAARTWRDMAFAPPDATVVIAHLNDNRLELGERAVGEHV